MQNVPPIFSFQDKFRYSSAKISECFCHHPQICKFPPIFSHSFCFVKIFRSPYFAKFTPGFITMSCFVHALCDFRLPPTLTMMHLCIPQCTYWTSLLLMAFVLSILVISILLSNVLPNKEKRINRITLFKLGNCRTE